MHYSVLDDVDSGRAASARLKHTCIDDVAINIDTKIYSVTFHTEQDGEIWASVWNKY